MASSTVNSLLAIFYLVIFLFATSDLKRFVFHVHISRVDRAPVEIYIDTSSSSLSLWYPISIGIIFNVFIIIFSLRNFFIIVQRRNSFGQLCVSTAILFFLFTVRLIVNITVTKTRNGLSTPTLVERSFLVPSLSLEEELTTLTLDWLIKCAGFIGTFIIHYKQKQAYEMDDEKRQELKLMTNFE
ncbi:unnamed protein product [Adineta ricciae]|uniref:Uncharacterized protein n=1 Tax=Adineta ricciae TaxID=249248 RepID=A0A814M277_ADIRI|nr:unnamed protein product [Adineta ricciae]